MLLPDPTNSWDKVACDEATDTIVAFPSRVRLPTELTSSICLPAIKSTVSLILVINLELPVAIAVKVGVGLVSVLYPNTISLDLIRKVSDSIGSKLPLIVTGPWTVVIPVSNEIGPQN